MMGLTLEQVKAKSAARLEGLQPVIKAAAEALIERSYARGVQIIITQGLRTIAEQDALYAQGRTKPGSIVTNARGGYSNHNFGWAIDFALLLPDGRTVSWDTLRDDDKDSLPDWSEVVEEAKKLGFEWGGDWRTFKDLPHLQMVFGLTTTQLRIGRQPTSAQIAAVERNLYNTTEAIKGDDILELTKYQWDALKNNVEALLKAGTISDKAWLTKISEKTLTVSELAWLSFILTTK